MNININIMKVLLLLTVLSLFIFGCIAPESAVSSAPAGEVAVEVAEDAEVAGELNELDELEELEGELDDLEWQEVEGAVTD